MNKKLIKFFISATIVIVSICVISCGKLTSPSKDAPTDLKIEKIKVGRIELTWSYLDTSDDTIQYIIARKVGEGNWNENYEAISDESRSFKDNIPTNDSLVYAYKVKVQNLSEGFSTHFSEVVAYLSAQTAPTDLSFVQTSQERLKISWIDHCVGEDGYYVDKRIGNESWTNKYKILIANKNSFTDNTTIFDTLYYRVTAFVGESLSGSVENSIVTNLMAPSNLTLEKPDNSKIKLIWNDNSVGEQGFYIDKKIGELDWQINYTQVDSNSTSFIDDIEQPCGTFSYRVRAYYETEYSAYSDEKCRNILLELVGSIPTSGDPTEVFVSNYNAFVSTKFAGLAIIDCSNPSAPYEITTMDLPDRTLSVFVQENLAYVTNHNGGFNLIDISNIYAPIITGSCGTGADGIPNDVFVYGDYAYVADGAAGLWIIITSGDPHFSANISTNGDARKVFIKENYDYAFIANGLNGGITIIDISDPSNPISVSNLPINGLSQDVYVLENYAYLANGENGLEIIDISDVNSPTLVADCPTNGFAYSVYAQDNYVYLADKDKGLIVIDVSNPLSPYILGNFEMSTEPVSIYKFGSYVYLADNEGLKIIQVAP